MKKVESFWWRSITKLIDQYKSHCANTSPKWSIYPSMGRSMAKVEILKFTFPELHYFLKKQNITLPLSRETIEGDTGILG
jgi:hypothetical protein